MKIVITPVLGKVLVKIAKDAGETKSGIKLVRQGEIWHNETALAEIVQIHPKEQEITVGQVVVIAGSAGRWIDPELVNDDEFLYRMIDKDEIIGVAEEELPLGA